MLITRLNLLGGDQRRVGCFLNIQPSKILEYLLWNCLIFFHGRKDSYTPLFLVGLAHLDKKSWNRKDESEASNVVHLVRGAHMG